MMELGEKEEKSFFFLFLKIRITFIRQEFWKRPGPDFDPTQL